MTRGPAATGPAVQSGQNVEQLSAVTLATADMAKCVSFYEALGFVKRYGGGQDAFTSFHAGAGYLNLQLDESWRPPPRVWGRAIFWVDDVDAFHARAVASGLKPHARPADAPWGERYFHITDPAGHEISLARPLSATG